MAAVFMSSDAPRARQLGKNGQPEYQRTQRLEDWREQLTQLSFQLTRTNNTDTHASLAKWFFSIISECANSYKQPGATPSRKLEMLGVLNDAYALTLFTRDIVFGKGEYALAYILVGEWLRLGLQWSPAIDLAQCAITMMMTSDGWFTEERSHPYGSWKDLKHFWTYLQSDAWRTGLCDVDAAELVEKMERELVGAAVAQLHSDIQSSNPSLCAKWMPREKSAQSHLFRRMAETMFESFLATANTDESEVAATKKACRYFRKLLSKLNQVLDTPQVKQCAGEWSVIDFDTGVSSITTRNQRRAFLNLTRNGEQRCDTADRTQCAINFKSHVEAAARGERRMKGKRVGVDAFVRDAVRLARDAEVGEIGAEDMTTLKAAIDAQWNDAKRVCGSLGDYVALVDTSGSMEDECARPLYSAIGLGIRIAEKSRLGKRVLTFSHAPAWVSLEDVDGFCDAVAQVREAPWGCNTNFNSALTMILEACVTRRLTSEEVKSITLVVLSDMNIDAAECGGDGTMSDLIRQRYHDAGVQASGEPWVPPTIVFWNLRSTEGFPCVSSQSNTTMISGQNPGLLQSFCEEGSGCLSLYTPWEALKKALRGERYAPARRAFDWATAAELAPANWGTV